MSFTEPNTDMLYGITIMNQLALKQQEEEIKKERKLIGFAQEAGCAENTS